jgi:hypothetical protein
MKESVSAGIARYFGLGVAAFLLASYSPAVRANPVCLTDHLCDSNGFYGQCNGQSQNGHCMCSGYFGGSASDDLDCMNCGGPAC